MAVEEAKRKAHEANQAADKAQESLDAASASEANASISQELSDKIIEKAAAEKEVKRLEAQKLRETSAQVTRRQTLKANMNKFQSYASMYNETYENILNGIKNTGTRIAAQLILVDPPYETRFVERAARKQLADLCEKTLNPGGTIVVFCDWKQADGWRQVFMNNTPGNPFVVEKLMPIIRDANFSYRSNIYGHKKMTEFALIAHRKDAASSDKGEREGNKKPNLDELHEVMGDAQSGSWLYDYLIDQTPPPANWRLKWKHESPDPKKLGTAVRPCAEKSSSVLASFILK